ncbi:hypothetical protein CAEBREN_12664, partial [Caenorhabditis brenneri]
KLFRSEILALKPTVFEFFTIAISLFHREDLFRSVANA